MGEESKEEEKKGQEETKEEEKKEEEKKKEEPPEIVLKVYMHCEACAKKVEKSLRKYQGVDEVKADSRAQVVVVKAKAAVDPVKISERVQKKSGRKTELISPKPEPPPEETKQEEPPKEEKKEEPTPITVTLKVKMHCEACAQVLQRRIKKMEGVESVATDMANEQVTVTGFVDPDRLVEKVYRRTRRQASIVKGEEKAATEKNDEGEKKEEAAAEGEKKEEEGKGAEKGEAENVVRDGDDADAIKRMEHWSSKYSVETYYDPAPQMFSDENPNACSVM